MTIIMFTIMLQTCALFRFIFSFVFFMNGNDTPRIGVANETLAASRNRFARNFLFE